jgi:hypothetical protein
VQVGKPWIFWLFLLRLKMGELVQKQNKRTQLVSTGNELCLRWLLLFYNKSVYNGHA